MSNLQPLNLQVNTGNKAILRIALPISASIVVPQINFITNNIFLAIGKFKLKVPAFLMQ